MPKMRRMAVRVRSILLSEEDDDDDGDEEATALSGVVSLLLLLLLLGLLPLALLLSPALSTSPASSLRRGEERSSSARWVDIIKGWGLWVDWVGGGQSSRSHQFRNGRLLLAQSFFCTVFSRVK